MLVVFVICDLCSIDFNPAALPSVTEILKELLAPVLALITSAYSVVLFLTTDAVAPTFAELIASLTSVIVYEVSPILTVLEV